jgi:predicted ArsR family transcriptional regulator
VSRRGRGRPPREYRIRVRAERRAEVDYPKLARALLEYAAMQERADATALTAPPTNVAVSEDDITKDATSGGGQ